MDERLEKTRRAVPTHFWFHGFRQFVTPVLREVAGGRTDLRILDCGCGVGQTLQMLASHGRPIGFEIEPGAAATAHSFGYPVARADITRIPFPESAFDLVVSFDVLACIEPDMAAVREMARVVRPGGRVVLTLAAFDALSGDHAEVWREVRRYTPSTARALAEQARLRVERVSFAFAALVPLMFAVRKTQRLLRRFRSRPSQADIETPWPPVNTALMRLLDAEAALTRYVPMPIGSSLIVVARKDGTARHP